MMSYEEAIIALGKAYGLSRWHSGMGGGTGQGCVSAEKLLEIIFDRKVTERTEIKIDRIARKEEIRIHSRYISTGLEPGQKAKKK